MSEILLPADLILGTVIQGPQCADWYWDQPDGAIDIRAVSGISHAEPAALAALAAWADYQRARGLTLKLDDSLKSPYAWKVSLLSTLAGRATASPSRLADFLQPTLVKTAADNTVLLQTIDPLLNLATDKQRETVLSCLTEILRNVVEHAESNRGAYVCCSHFRNADRVSIAVVDTGVGVPTTIRRKYGSVLTDAQAVEAAVQWRVTGAKPSDDEGISYGIASNYGVGLYYARSAAVHTGGQFALISGGACARSDKPEQILTGHTGANWKGTVVAISFRPSQAGQAWERTRESLATPITEQRKQLVNWGPAPAGSRQILITPTVAGFVEDKDQANRIREEIIVPEVRAGRAVEIDLTKARIISHTFTHALLFMPMLMAGKASQKLLHIRAKEGQVKDVVRIVAQYAAEELTRDSQQPGQL